MPARLLRAMNPGLSNASLKLGNAVLFVERSDRPTSRGLEQEFVRGVRGRKEIALTFDCGWATDRNLSELLETLHHLDVHATFFLTGIFLRNVPDAPARIALAGHRLGNHTWSHLHCTKLSDGQFLAQIEGVEQAVAAGPAIGTFLFKEVSGISTTSTLPDTVNSLTTGTASASGFTSRMLETDVPFRSVGIAHLKDPGPSGVGAVLFRGDFTPEPLSTHPFWRPPFGDRDKRILRIAAQAGYRAVYWTVDSLDWVKEPAATPESVFRQVCQRPFERAKDDPDPLDGAIVLMHLAGKPTRHAIEQIVPYLKERGYRFVTVQRLLEP